MTRQKTLVCLFAAALLATVIVPLIARAEHTRSWRQTDYSEFDKGTAKGVALRNDGKLMPAPKFISFADPNMAYLWTLKMDSRGRLYAGGGSDAKVLRFDDSGKSTTVFEASELAAQAIAFDKNDNLYVGTSPDGKVYKVTPDGKKSVYFEPKTKYIWALAVDSQGVLFVGTGDKGEVFAVTPDGKGQSFYQNDERHARSLAFDAKGNLLIGTDPDGLILRIEIGRKNSSAAPEAGASFVVYETNKKEVTSLLADSSGNLYAAAVGEKQRPGGASPVIQSFPLVQPMPPAINAQNLASVIQQTPAAAPTVSYPYFPSTTGGAEVVKISTDGAPETLWSSREDLVFAIDQSSGGKLLLGTGNKGAIIELEGNDVFSSVAKTASAQVTSLVSGPGGKIFVATANPGKIFTLGPGFESQGSFESETFDAKIFSHWGRLTWWGENGATTGKVAFYVRSGNTSSPEKNWSPWAGPFKNSGGETVSCPPARFAQWKAVFLDTDGGGAPSISWVSLAYLPKNVGPVIDDIAVQDPGIRLQGFNALVGGAGGAPSAPVQLRLPQRGTGSTPVAFVNQDALGNRPPKVDVPPQGFAERGYQSVLWSAHDDNDDDILFTIYYRGEGEKNWRLLKDKLTQKYYSWDTATMPDGAYDLKIVASDSPSNPAGQALSTERESERFEIANTPPRIENLHAEQASPTAKVSFDGISSSGAIARAQYSLDGGDWQIAFPVGLLSDAPKESYQLELHGLATGEHTIAVRITDQYENATTAKVTFSVSVGKSK
jgi:sugar lactone lactonase YvrE